MDYKYLFWALCSSTERGGHGLDPLTVSNMTPKQASILLADHDEIKASSVTYQAEEEKNKFFREKSKNWTPRHRN